MSFLGIKQGERGEGEEVGDRFLRENEQFTTELCRTQRKRIDIAF